MHASLAHIQSWMLPRVRTAQLEYEHQAQSNTKRGRHHQWEHKHQAPSSKRTHVGCAAYAAMSPAIHSYVLATATALSAGSRWHSARAVVHVGSSRPCSAGCSVGMRLVPKLLR